MTSAAFLACLAPPWVHMLSYWIPVSVLGGALALGVVCFAVELRRRHFRWSVVYAVLLALQPGWGLISQELSGVGIRVRADCGYSQRSLSLFLLAASVAVFVIIWRRLPVRRRSYVFGLAVAFTAVCVARELFDISGIGRAIPDEIYASLFTGFGGRPLDLLVLVLVCVLFFFIQRLRFRRAV